MQTIPSEREDQPDQRRNVLLGGSAMQGEEAKQKRPSGYDHAVISTQAISYLCCDESGYCNPFVGGVLASNETLWLDTPTAATKNAVSTKCYSERAGLILLATRYLRMRRS